MRSHSFLRPGALLVLLAACAAARAGDPVAIMKTSMGTIEITLDPHDAPRTVKNFVGLAKKKFYDGIRFHRVVKGFVIQAGDPQSKDPARKEEWGRGGESIYGGTFADEIDPSAPVYKTGYVPGVVAMANRGPNTNTSQFFIMCGGSLAPKYTIFGKVTKGMDIVRRIENVAVDAAARPSQDVFIEKVTIR